LDIGGILFLLSREANIFSGELQSTSSILYITGSWLKINVPARNPLEWVRQVP